MQGRHDNTHDIVVLSCILFIGLVINNIVTSSSADAETGATRLAVSRGQQTRYHFGSVATFR